MAFVESGRRRLIASLSMEAQILLAIAPFDDQRIKRRHRQFQRLAASRFELLGRAPGKRGFRLGIAADRAALALAHQIIVKNEPIAIGDQQVGGRLLDAALQHLEATLAIRN